MPWIQAPSGTPVLGRQPPNRSCSDILLDYVPRNIAAGHQHVLMWDNNFCCPIIVAALMGAIPCPLALQAFPFSRAPGICHRSSS